MRLMPVLKRAFTPLFLRNALWLQIAFRISKCLSVCLNTTFISMSAKNYNNVASELSTIKARPASSAAMSEVNKVVQDEEVASLEKEQQALKENMNKKLMVLENSMFRAKSEFEQVQDAVHKLQEEKITLEQDAKTAKLQALDTATKCQELLERTKVTMALVESYERQRNLHQKEVVAKQQRMAKLQDDVKQGKSVLEQLEARWKQGEKENEELLARAKSLRRERERIEASAKSKENTILKEADKNFRRLTDHMEKLTEEISQLKLKESSSSIAALRTDVRREEECVMCLSEKVSVVFVPCGHQVVCAKCNELHEKQGVECPACRAFIAQRVIARPASSSMFF